MEPVTGSLRIRPLKYRCKKKVRRACSLFKKYTTIDFPKLTDTFVSIKNTVCKQTFLQNSKIHASFNDFVYNAPPNVLVN